MRAVKTKDGYKIRVGWWIFGYYLKAKLRRLKGVVVREDAVFNTYKEAKNRIDELRSN